MSGPIKIIQLTDCHVSAAPDVVYRGIDPRATFRALLPAVRDWAPDLVMLTGDLAEDASEAAYVYLRDSLREIEAPILSMPGNHDDAEAQRTVFPQTAVEAPLVRDAAGWRIILLNSAAPGRIEGVLAEAMLGGLSNALEGSEDPALVALHHQPVAIGSPWIDRHALRNAEAFWSVLDQYQQVRAVCWGHIHQAFDAKRDAVRLLGSPATSSNSLPGQKRFTADGAGPACRWFELEPEGGFKTGLLRASTSVLGQ